MARSSFVRCAFVFGCFVTASVALAQAPPASTPLSLEDVVKDTKSGISDEIIITKIKKNGRAFNLSGDEIRELTHSGISGQIVKYLIDPSLPYAPAPPPPPPAAPSATAPPAAPAPEVRTKNYPPDARAGRLPPEPGLYRFEGEMPLKTDVRLLLGENQGPGLTKVIMKKGKAIGYLLGPMANTKVNEASPLFYLRLAEGKSIEEVVLLAMDQTKERREVEIGQTLEKQELKAESMRPFDSTEVGPHLFKVTLAKPLVKGEYLFLLLGSAEPPKGTYGKVYDFSIQAPRK
jgi:hypothetical protein